MDGKLGALVNSGLEGRVHDVRNFGMVWSGFEPSGPELEEEGGKSKRFGVEELKSRLGRSNDDRRGDGEGRRSGSCRHSGDRRPEALPCITFYL